MKNRLNEEDKIELYEFYRSALQQYGNYDSRAVRWNDFYTQNIRFKTFLEIGNLENKKILDVGCGLGDFYFYLKSNIEKFDYLGIDIFEEYINAAKTKYPEGSFKTGEIYDIKTDSFDYVFGSGIFSLKLDNHVEKYKQLIMDIYKRAKIGCGFNMLKKGKHPDDANHVAYYPAEIETFCKQWAKRVKLIEGYLDYDFTIFLYK